MNLADTFRKVHRKSKVYLAFSVRFEYYVSGSQQACQLSCHLAPLSIKKYQTKI